MKRARYYRLRSELLKRCPLYYRLIYINRICYDINNPGYKTHGGIGITVANYWKLDFDQPYDSEYNLAKYDDYETYIMSLFPYINKDDHILTRIDPKKNYSKGNIRMIRNNGSCERRTLFNNAIVKYKNLYFFSDEIFFALCNNRKYALSLTKRCSRIHKGDLEKQFEEWKNSRYYRLRKQGKEWEEKIKEIIKNKRVFSYKSDPRKKK